MQPSKNIRFRWLEPGEVRLGMDVISRLWNKNHILAKDETLFRWQFAQRGPDKEHIGFFVCEADEGVVACNGMIFLPTHIYGRSIRGGIGSITFVAEPYRIQSLGMYMMREIDKSLDMSGGVALAKRITMFYRLEGRYVTDAFPRYVAIADRDAIEMYCHFYGYTDEELKGVLMSCSRLQKKKAPKGFTVDEITEECTEEWGHIWSTLFAPQLIGFARSADFIRWRYLEHPTFKYTVLAVRNKGNICGIAVFRNIILSNGTNVFRILDFLSTDPASGEFLAAAMLEYIPKNCAFAECAAFGRQWYPLQLYGFTKEGSTLLSVRTNPPEKNFCCMRSAFRTNLPSFTAQSFMESPDVYITLADSDQDRPN